VWSIDGMVFGHLTVQGTTMPFGKASRWLSFVLLLCIGFAGATDLIRFSRKAAADETFCFSSAYTAARLAIRGEANGNMQNFGWFEAQTRRYGFKATDIFAGNPPSAALIMTPIAGLKHQQARLVWTWFSLLCWTTGVAILGFDLVTRCGGSAVAAAPALLSLATLFAPVKSNIEVGHVYLFVFLLQSVGCWLWLRHRTIAAGASIGALLAFKGYGVPLIALGVLRRDWRFAGAAAVTFAGLGTLAGFLLGFRQWVYFVETYLGTSISGFRTPALQTLKSFLSYAPVLPTVRRGSFKVLTPPAEHLLSWLLAITFTALLVWLSEFRPSNLRADAPAVVPPSPAMLGACVLMNLIFSPLAEDHAYPVAMTALLLMIPELCRLEITTAGAIMGGVLLSWPFHLANRMLTGPWNLLTDFARLWGAVILLIAALLSEWRRRRGNGVVTQGWPGAVLACSLGVVLTLWYAKPWRDPVARGPLLAVSQNEGNGVTLVRLDVDERVVSTIPLGCEGPFGLAFGTRRDWLYAACPAQSEVSLIDLRRRQESAKFKAGKLPTWVRLRTGSNEVWISNGGSGTVTIYRTGTSTVVGEFSTGSAPSDIVFSAGDKLAWVSNEGSGTVSLIDGESRNKIRDVPVGRAPRGMAMTHAGDRLVVTNSASDSVSIVDTRSFRELAQIPVCDEPVDVGMSRHGGVELAYVACSASGSVDVIDVDRFEEIQRIAVGKKPFGIAVHPNGDRVYVCVSGFNRLVVIEAGRPSRVLRHIKLDGSPLQVAVAP
jgi:YVTN family beta-propeller protein